MIARRFRAPLRALLALLIVCFVFACADHQPPSTTPLLKLDILIINGLVYDGSGGAGRSTSIGISGERISFIGDHEPVAFTAQRTIDAAGKMVVPGFIDAHTHSLSELQNPQFKSNQNYLTQGVTTVIVGNDGGGTYQVNALASDLETRGVGTNVGFLVGHGAVREAVMGREDRLSSAAELEQMKQLVKQGMEEGGLGLSSGLYYAPGSFSSTEEVVELARVAAQYGGLYDSHIRDESTYNIGLVASIEEAIEIGRQAGLPVHIAHIKALGVDVWGQSQNVIATIEQARDEGIEVNADQYPWRASGTHLNNAIVPRWVMADSTEQYQARLRDTLLLEQIKPAIAENIRRRGGAESLLIVECPEPSYQGKNLAEIAALEGLEPLEAALKVLRLGSNRVVSFNMLQQDINSFMVQKWVMTSSDGNDGHPRKYASFPKKYWQYVHEDKLLDMQSFVRSSSGLTADTFGLINRGYLRAGYFADLAIIDPDNFRPRADYFHWNTLSTGVEYLFVNGAVAIEAGQVTAALAGKAVRR